MITQKLYGVREAAIALAVLLALLMSFRTAFAQTSSFTPPSGYSQVNNSGIYYNSVSGMYYNPMTGQYSNLQPLGQATMTQGGQYNVPSGYTQYNNGNYYYNSSTGWYYDPITGFYSTTAPTNTGVTMAQAQGYTPPGSGGVITPGVPNTGVGTTGTLGILLLASVLAMGGSLYLSRRIAA